jgi:hypothetical protein
VLGSGAGRERLCALHALSTNLNRRRTVEHVADTWVQECAGRGDGTDCPNGETEDLVDGVRCEECRHHWELDETERGRRLVADDGLTRPLGEPWEAGPGTAA